MESTLVIKVKYGETLRRFNAPVLSETCKLGLDMNGLRAKICSFFNFPSNADLKMTYVDEDGDVVTLVDDDDLYDVIRRKLKILRIDVELSGEINKHPYSGQGITVDSPAKTICHDIHPILGYTFRFSCEGCGAHLPSGDLLKSTMKENLALCPMCCTKLGIEHDYIRTTSQSGFSRKLPSPRGVHNQNPGLGPQVKPPVWRDYGSKPGLLEQKSCLIRNDNLWGMPFFASRVDNGEEGSSLEANLLDKLPKNDKELFFRHSIQGFPCTAAAFTSTESRPDVGHKKLSAVSVVAPPLFENGSDRKTTEALLREIEEKRLGQVGKIRDVLTSDYYLEHSVDSFDEDEWNAALDRLEEMGFGDMPMVERLLKKNDGNMRRTVVDLIAREKA